MSLINDALRKASKTDRSRQRPPAEEPIATLKPIVTQGSNPLGLALWAGVVLALAVGGWMFRQWWHESHRPRFVRRAPPAVVSPGAQSPPGVAATAPASAPEPIADSSTEAKSSDEAWPLELKLTAIIFNPKNPVALISGRSVGVGDMFEDIRVAKIEPDRVTVEWNGQSKVLMMK